MKCPKCEADCQHDSVDVGVGVIHGPWGCPICAWSEDSEYDLSEGQSPIKEDGGVIDQYGGYHPAGSMTAKAVRWAEDRVAAEHQENENE